jgi:DNA-binding NtrC family response regulator
MPTILIVDDDDAVRALLNDLLSAKYECHTASTAEQALQCLEVEKYDAVLTDIAMSGLDGLQLLKQVRLRDLETPVILISGKGRDENNTNPTSLGAFAYVTKPFNLDEVEEIVAQAVWEK